MKKLLKKILCAACLFAAVSTSVFAQYIQTKKDENGSVLENTSTEDKDAPNINKDSRGRTSKKKKKDSNKKEDSPSITGKMAEASKDLENNCK